MSETIARKEWAAMLLAAFFILGPITWPFIHYVWQSQPQDQTDHGQQYQRIQTIITAFSVLANFLTLGAIIFQAVIAKEQTGIQMGQSGIAERQVSIMEGLPVLYPIFRNIGPEDFRTTKADTLYQSDHMHFSDPKISFAMKNYGTAPAILLDVGGRLTIGTDPPAAISGDVAYIPMPEERMIAHNSITPDFTVKIHGVHWTIDRATHLALMKGEIHAWFAGRVVYSDLNGNCTAQHICWRCNVSRCAVDPYPAERNYKEKTAWEPHEPPSAKGSDESLMGI